MKRIRRRTRNRIIAAVSTLSVLVLGVIMVTVFSKAGLPEVKEFLGDAIDFGIVADSLDQKGHMETNFVVNTYTGNGQWTGNTEFANAAGQIWVGSIADKLNVQSAAKVYTTKDNKDKVDYSHSAEYNEVSADDVANKVSDIRRNAFNYASSVVDKKTAGIQMYDVPEKPIKPETKPEEVQEPTKPTEPEAPVEPEKVEKPGEEPTESELEEPEAPEDPSDDADEAEEKEYEEAYQKYLEDLEAYNKAQKDFEDEIKSYNDSVDAYDKYLKDVEDYETKSNKYREDMAQYEKDCAQYKKDLKKYNDYLKALDTWNNYDAKKKEYDSKLDAFKKVFESNGGNFGDLQNKFGIDVSGVSDTVVYINADEIVRMIGRNEIQNGGLKLKKNANQTIVLNVTESNVTIPQYFVNGNQGGEGGNVNDKVNAEAQQNAASSVIWNMPYASNVTLDSDNMKATVIAPDASVYIKVTAAGWLICESVSNGGEWHMVYRHITEPTPTPIVTATPTKATTPPKSSKTPKPTKTPKPVIEYPIEVTKEFIGDWPNGAEFKFDISYDDEKSDGNNECINYKGLKSVILTKDKSTQSMGKVKFDLSKFTGYESRYYSNKTVDGKSRGYVECCEYMFTITEDSTYKPTDKGVNYDAIEYDTTPRHIKIWVNVEKDKDGKIVDYWSEPREAVGDAWCTERKGATKFTNSTTPFIDYSIDVEKAFEGEWPEGAEFKFLLSIDDAKNGFIDTKDLKSSIILTKDNPTQSMGIVHFDLKNFDGWKSGTYKGTKCYPYQFTITEDSTYKPTDKGVNYDAIEYDTAPRHIKIWVNVKYDDSGKPIRYWIEPREAVGDAWCTEKIGAAKFTNKNVTPPPAPEVPTLSYDIDVEKAFEGEWPDGAEFKFDIEREEGEGKTIGSLDCIDYTGLKSVVLTKKFTTSSMGTIKFDLSKFTGDLSDESVGGYTGTKTEDGRVRGNVYYAQYMFKVTEDSSYKPTDNGVDYDAIEYDTTPRHIKIFVNVEKDKDGKIVDCWLEPREAVGDAQCTERNGATVFTNKLKPTPTPTTEVAPTPTPTLPGATNPPYNPPTTTNPPYNPPTTSYPPVVVATPTPTPLVEVEEFVPLSAATPEVTPTPQPEEIVPEEEVPLSKVPTKPEDETPLVTVEEKVPLSATVPETGDSMNPIIPIAGMGLSLIAIVGVVVIRKKKML